MPTWISKDGEFVPAIEKVALVDKYGEPYIYEGPDRAAMEYLREIGEEKIGTHFREFSENIERAHEKKMTVDEFCKVKINPDEKRAKVFEENISKKVLHQSPKRNAPLKGLPSGGANTAPGGSVPSMQGGFEGQAEAIAKVK